MIKTKLIIKKIHIFLVVIAAFLSLCVVKNGKNTLQILCCEGDNLNDELIFSKNSINYTSNSDNKMVGYFKNLNENFPFNEQGSCSWVALSMLLGYYDAFCYDNVLDQWYTADEDLMGYETTGTLTNSPGVNSYFGFNDFLNSDLSSGSPDNFNYHDVAKFIDISKRNNIQSHLIYDAINYGYISNTDFENSLGTSIDVIGKTAKKYLESYGFNSNLVYYYNYGIVGIDNSSFITTLKKAISKGNPVILAMSDNTINGGHAVIAYDYDESNSTIYCHSGWHQENSTYVDSRVFGKITGYMYIDLSNNSKNHSDNFYINSQYVCGCSNLVSY